MTLESERKTQELYEEDMKIKDMANEARHRISAIEEMLKQQIEKTRDECSKKQNILDSLTKQLNENSEKIAALKKDNEEYIKQQEALQNEYLENKDEPERHKKKADMMESGKRMMERDLKMVEDVNKQKDKEIDELLMKITAEKQMLELHSKEMQKAKGIALTIQVKYILLYMYIYLFREKEREQLQNSY